MSALKRGLGLGRLSVRGKSAVATAIYLKAAAYNMKQAARALRKRGQCPQNTLAATISVLLYGYKRIFSFVETRKGKNCQARTTVGASQALAA